MHERLENRLDSPYANTNMQAHRRPVSTLIRDVHYRFDVRTADVPMQIERHTLDTHNYCCMWHHRQQQPPSVRVSSSNLALLQ
jgi:hypothetical protein